MKKTSNSIMELETKSIFPFGKIIKANNNKTLINNLSPLELKEIIHKEKVVVLRGFEPLKTDEMLDYAKQFGNLLEWNFGYILDLEIKENTDNYLFTAGNVPFHWDGAFAKSVPSFLFFQCLEGNSSMDGGEGTFCNTLKVLEKATAEELSIWRNLEVSYGTDKKAHYGGAITQSLVHFDEDLGKEVLRFAEPLNEDSVQLNPIEINISGFSKTEQDNFLAEFIPKLYEEDVCYQHKWGKGDFVFIDNSSLLHGRNPLKENKDRRLQRIHIL